MNRLSYLSHRFDIHSCLFCSSFVSTVEFLLGNEGFFSLPSPTASAKRTMPRDETSREKTGGRFSLLAKCSDQSEKNVVVLRVHTVRTGPEMKCFCKYCSAAFVCQRQSPADLCYFRHAIGPNITDDYGCVQADGSKFFVSSASLEEKLRSEKRSFQCDTTDLFYRTECCSDVFCNVRHRPVTTPTRTLSFTFPLVLLLVLVLAVAIVLFVRRKFNARLASIKTECSSLDDFSAHVPLVRHEFLFVRLRSTSSL